MLTIKPNLMRRLLPSGPQIRFTIGLQVPIPPLSDPRPDHISQHPSQQPAPQSWRYSAVVGSIIQTAPQPQKK